MTASIFDPSRRPELRPGPRAWRLPLGASASGSLAGPSFRKARTGHPLGKEER